MSQQTALELVISQLKEHITKSAHNQLGTNRTGDYRIGLVKAIDFCEQAKELEKQQIIEFADKYDAYVVQGGTLTAEQYYNETFKTKKP
jgi:polysaccharide pyruvyl transferase WcaK-like protein